MTHDTKLQDWLKAAIAFSGISQAELGRQLSATLRRNIDRAAVNKMTKGGRAIAGDEMLEIERITGFNLPVEDSYCQAPLIGYVTDGSSVIVLEQGIGDKMVESYRGAPKNTKAIEIKTDSLGAAFNGWLAHYDDVLDYVPDQYLGLVCVVWVDDGRVLFRQVFKAEIDGLYTLRSTFEPPMHEIKIDRIALIRNMQPQLQPLCEVQ